MRFAILCSPESWYLRDLRRAARDEHEITAATFRELVASVGGIDRTEGKAMGPSGATRRVEVVGGKLDLNACDAVLVRTMPPGSLEQVVFRMDALGQLAAAGKVVLNPPRAIEASVDKFLTTAKLHAAGLLTPRTVVCQTREDAMEAFERLGGDVVVKPLFGAEGRGITRLVDAGLAERAFQLLAQLGATIYLQEFIAHHGYDVRIFLIGSRCWAIRRSNPLDWRTNVSRGATAERFEPSVEMIEMAIRAANAVGAPIAGVDLLPGINGNCYAIEVNAVPGWQALSRAHDVDIAREVLRFVASEVARSG